MSTLLNSAFYRDSRGFTLIELIVSVTLLSVIMLSVFMIYSNLIQVNKRLEAMRMVQENVRNITEQIATDIREKWIDLGYYDGSTSLKTNGYTTSGNMILAIRGGTRYYPMKDSLVGPVLCSDTDLHDLNTHCYVGKEVGTTRTAISDERVRIDAIRFFLSGTSGATITNLGEEGKATIAFSIGIDKKAGVNSEVAKQAHMFVETTVSEKAYKKY